MAFSIFVVLTGASLVAVELFFMSAEVVFILIEILCMVLEYLFQPK